MIEFMEKKGFLLQNLLSIILYSICGNKNVIPDALIHVTLFQFDLKGAKNQIPRTEFVMTSLVECGKIGVCVSKREKRRGEQRNVRDPNDYLSFLSLHLPLSLRPYLFLSLSLLLSPSFSQDLALPSSDCTHIFICNIQPSLSNIPQTSISEQYFGLSRRH